MPADANTLPLFGSKEEVIFACDDGALKTHDRVSSGEFRFRQANRFGNADKKVIVTTVGRVRFSEIWPPELGFPNKSVKKSELGDLIWKCYKFAGHEKTVVMLTS